MPILSSKTEGIKNWKPSVFQNLTKGSITGEFYYLGLDVWTLHIGCKSSADQLSASVQKQQNMDF